MATIKELLERGRTLSFEIMPPRNPERELQLEKTLIALRSVNPSFISITYGAGGSTRERTFELVCQLLETGNTQPMAHLTCAAHRRSDLVNLLKSYADKGLRNLLALHGDPPLRSTENLPEGDLKKASELVELAREVSPDFCVAVAMHPEGHPHSDGREIDRRYQAEKLAIADFGVTQFFFNVDDYFRLVENMHKLGVDKPIIPGIMPPENLAQLAKMGQMSGASIPVDVVQRLEAVNGSSSEARKVGVEVATKIAQRLLENDIPGLHFYTMNKSAAVLEICRELNLPALSTSSEVMS